MMLLRLARRWRFRDAVCESCGATADVVLRDGSTWCAECHGSALRLGYDRDFGTAIR